MKRCYMCTETKPYEEFHKCASAKDGRRKTCKECKKILNKNEREKNRQYYLDYMREWNKSKKDGYQYVYLLEDYNYVGVTDNLYHRFAVHKSRNNRDCTNYKLLLKTKNRTEALELEKKYHNMGYAGAEKHSSYQ